MKEKAIKEIRIDNKILRIFLDENPENPRKWNDLSKMLFFGQHKHLGDNHNIFHIDNFNNREDFILKVEQQIRKQIKDIAIIKPVHMYCHSGSSISTSSDYPYNCPWDSGTIGFVLITKDDIRKEYNVKRVTKKELNKAELVLEYEVETLNKFIKGEVYGFDLLEVFECENGFEHETSLDCFYGFYGNDFSTNGIADFLDDERLLEALRSA